MIHVQLQLRHLYVQLKMTLMLEMMILVDLVTWCMISRLLIVLFLYPYLLFFLLKNIYFLTLLLLLLLLIVVFKGSTEFQLHSRKYVTGLVAGSCIRMTRRGVTSRLVEKCTIVGRTSKILDISAWKTQRSRNSFS